MSIAKYNHDYPLSSVTATFSTDEEGNPLRMNMNVVEGFRLEKSCLVISGGLVCFTAVEKAGCSHVSVVTRGGPLSMNADFFNGWIL